MLDSAEQSISLMFALGRLIREQGVHDEKLGIPSFMQLEMMKRIGDSTKTTSGLTMKEISQFLCIRAPSVTVLITELIRLKLVKRVADPNDRRVIRIILTPQGKKLLDTHYPRRAHQLRKVISTLPQSEQVQFVAILQHINDNYKKTI